MFVLILRNEYATDSSGQDELPAKNDELSEDFYKSMCLKRHGSCSLYHAYTFILSISL